MAAYKTLTTQDLIISPLTLNKSFNFIGGTSLTGSNLQIGRYFGKNSNFDTDKSTTGPTGNSEYQTLVFNQIQQLYYSNYVGETGELKSVATASFNPDGTITGDSTSPLYNNFLSTTLDPKRYFPTASDALIGVISIPQYMYGDHIQPNSVKIEVESGSFVDDGEGRLKKGNNFVGNVIYEHGIIVLTGGSRSELGFGEGYGIDEYGNQVYGGRVFNNSDVENFINSPNISCSFSSSYTMYETQYKCTIGESEFNFSQNPSIISGSNGIALDFTTGSSFTPYITTVGLYNDQRDLIAVGKLAQPLPISKTTDTSILINIDRH